MFEKIFPPSSKKQEGGSLLTREEGVVALMESSKSQKEWELNKEKVYKANGNVFPLFYEKSIRAVYNRVKTSWPKERSPETQEDGAGVDSQIEKDVTERSKGNPGAMFVLSELTNKGSEIYNSVAPNLGTGPEVFEKFEECGKNFDALIEKFGK
ncbi:hypothetical protein HYZ82_00060 [Candidatus Nomurabacteria bacterium]|nr:hypothetical protein [Candidatus Nomurabacteria bacterium]